VCKLIERKKLSSRGEQLIKNEISNLQMIQSKGVIQLAQFYKTHQAYYIFCDYCNGSDLSQIIRAKGGFLCEEAARLIFSKIVRGVDDLHSAGIIHRDIKAPNILIDFKSPI